MMTTLALLLALADDWPQWLGPTRDNASPAAIAPWKDVPATAWRHPVGEGHSSPVVAGGRVFLHAKVRDRDEEEVIAWDAASGKELWRQAYPRAPFSSIFGLGPRATPAVSGEKLYTCGVTGILTCWEATSGKRLWQVDTLKEFNAKNLFFGISCSPLIEGDLLFLNVGGPGASIVAFKKETGDVAWKALDDKASYSSPVALGKGKERQIVFLTQQGLVGVSPADGSLFWKFPLVDKLSESSTTPVLAGDVLIGSSVTYGSAGLKLETREGRPAFSEAWKNPKLTCYISTPVPVGRDHVYLVTGTIIPPPSATLRCVDAKSGKELWSKPGIGKYHAALLRTAGDRLLMLDDAGGLALIEPDGAEYKELARSKVSGPTWAHPALAGGRLYLRDDKSLLCLRMGE
ncbi:MAG TPA: PQQ-binding-like beta-propeller repeat protein [Planctomycetota bacterium]|nr:PQQ-binding-like beta-propeller repeat protein [Planctomycetota bacterium]